MAAGRPTVMLAEPVIVEITVSFAVSVWVPTARNVAENDPAPLTRVESAGRVAVPSEDVKWTVPVYPVATLLNASSAVTVKPKEEPDETDAGATTVKCVTAAGLTIIAFEVPVIDEVTISVAVMVCDPAVLRVAGNIPVPLVRVESPEKDADPSVLVKCTVPG
jgi:hypothetical protein